MGVNGFRSAASPTASVAVAGVGAGVSELCYGIDYKFNIDMFREWSSVAGCAGSDYCVVKAGSVSVSALRSSFAECEWRSASYGRYGEEGRRETTMENSNSEAESRARKSAL